jgi:CAP12/Pycsar effector protein, TIR domain
MPGHGELGDRLLQHGNCQRCNYFSVAKRSSTDTPKEEPALKKPQAEAATRLRERLEAGRALLPSVTTISNLQELRERKQAFYTWNDFNTSLLRTLFSGAIDDEYRSPMAFGFGGSMSPAEQVQDFEGDVTYYLRHLESILERLPLWASDDCDVSERTQILPDGPIFVVHGHDGARKSEVARTLERATGRTVTILHEAANGGRTIIEKFEHHAAAAWFAVVLLTGDDVGRPNSLAMTTHAVVRM